MRFSASKCNEAQAKARKKSKAASASATCAQKRPHFGAAVYRITVRQ